MSRISIGVLGKANIATRSVIPAILELPDQYALAGIATRQSAESAWNGIPLVQGYDRILDSGQIDAVYIPLPNALHYEWIKKALDRNIHVLVEKSLACTLEEAVALNDLARSRNLVLLENFQFRKHAQLAFVQSVLSDGILGDLRVFRSTFCFPPFADKGNIRYDRSLGGGALLDAGAYPLKISQILLGNDLEVASATLNYDDQCDVDIWGGAFLKQKNGPLFAQIAFGFDHHYQCNVEIIGSKGRLYTNRIFTAGDAVKPEIILETQENGVQKIGLDADSHFKNMLGYFSDLMNGRADKTQEYRDNINQARLLQELRERAND